MLRDDKDKAIISGLTIITKQAHLITIFVRHNTKTHTAFPSLLSTGIYKCSTLHHQQMAVESQSMDLSVVHSEKNSDKTAYLTEFKWH